MKYLKLFEEIKSFNFKRKKINKNNIDYYFSDGKYNFKVKFEVEDEGEWELKWFVNKDNKWTLDIVSTDIWSLMQTIFSDILNDFINFSSKSYCHSIYIEGLSKDFEREALSQRTRVYLRYLKNHIPEGWKIDRDFNCIILFKED